MKKTLFWFGIMLSIAFVGLQLSQALSAFLGKGWRSPTNKTIAEQFSLNLKQVLPEAKVNIAQQYHYPECSWLLLDAYTKSCFAIEVAVPTPPDDLERMRAKILASLEEPTDEAARLKMIEGGFFTKQKVVVVLIHSREQRQSDGSAVFDNNVVLSTSLER